VFRIESGVSVTISGLTITDGFGGIDNAGNLTLSFCTVSDNTVFSEAINVASIPDATGTPKIKQAASTTAEGGGIFNESTGILTLKGCTVKDNAVMAQSSNTASISGAASSTITSTVEQAAAALAEGGGIYNEGKLTIQASQILDNTATAEADGTQTYSVPASSTMTGTGAIASSVLAAGAGIYNAAGGTLFMDLGSAIRFNTANATISDTVTDSGPVSVPVDTASAALAQGGGLDNEGAATVSFATITANAAVASIAIVNPPSGTNASASSTQGGGIFNDTGATLRLSLSLDILNSAQQGADLDNNGGIVTLIASVVGNKLGV
jgi:hypothetical protein